MGPDLLDPLLDRMTGRQLAMMATTSKKLQNRVKQYKNRIRGDKNAFMRNRNRQQRAESKRTFDAMIRTALYSRDPFVKKRAEERMVDYLKSHNKNFVTLNDDGYTEMWLNGHQFVTSPFNKAIMKINNAVMLTIRPKGSLLTKRNVIFIE